MGDVNEAHPSFGAQSVDEVKDGALHRHVQCRGGLIRQQKSWVGCQRRSDSDALTLPPGKGSRKTTSDARCVAESYSFQQFVQVGAARGSGATAVLCRSFEYLLTYAY
jgi:hypothetical protein